MGDGAGGSSPTDRVRLALRDAAVGKGALGVGASLDDLAGVGEVSVSGDRVSISVALPVPSPDVRRAIEAEVRAAVRDAMDGATVSVEWTPDPADPGPRVDRLPDVRNVIAVASGKGGVGKSTVAANVAAALADAGAAVGLLDADVYGPNAPALLGVDDGTPLATRDDRIAPREAHGVRVMSMAFVVGEDDPVIWRGPLVDDLLDQLTSDVAWGDLDYLFVDLPPGTGDAQLSLVQHLPVAGAVLVTTPQAVAVDDARRGLRQFVRYDVPVLGVVENMAGFACPDCGVVHDVFGAGGADDLADEFDVPVIGRIPLDPDVGVLSADRNADRGLSVPLVGRLRLPRTREERAGLRPPSALREDGGTTGSAFRELATRTAARANAAAIRNR